MLVITRKKNETIHIGGQTVVITVVDIRGQCVRIGVEAAPDIPIHRGEVQADIEAGIPQKPKVS